jgi:hypothetical protein
MRSAFLALSLLISAKPIASPVAALRVDGDRSSFMVKVTGSAPNEYRVSIDCSERCAKPIHYAETTSDTPLGIFSRDQDGLVFSTWSGGSVYRVLVWSVTDDGVRKVTELSSRGRPDFLSNADGEAVIQTYEADTGTAPLHHVRWTFHQGRFARTTPPGS